MATVNPGIKAVFLKAGKGTPYIAGITLSRGIKEQVGASLRLLSQNINQAAFF
jgi:hypothetical protein